MKLHFTSGYHPEADGQTEQMNQTLDVMIRLGQAFWHQKTAAVIDEWLWELERHLWEGVTLIEWHGNGPDMDTQQMDAQHMLADRHGKYIDNNRVPSRMWYLVDLLYK